MLESELGERAVAPGFADLGVAVLDLFDDMLRHGAAADDVAQVLGDFVDGAGRPVSEQEDGAFRHGAPHADRAEPEVWRAVWQIGARTP